jgi:CRP/FNR family transcriptional regulator, cyclic AMP receptor protein
MQENPAVVSAHMQKSREEICFAIEAAALRAGGESMLWEPKAGPLPERSGSGGSVYLLRRGLGYLLYRASPAMEMMLALVRPGECFRCDQALPAGPDAVEARVICASEFLRLESNRWSAECAANPGLSLLLLELAARRQREIVQRMGDCMTVPIGERLPRLLWDFCVCLNGRTGEAVTLPLTQSALARIAGCTRVTLHRGVNALTRRGLVRVRRGRVEVPDPAALARYAGSGLERRAPEAALPMHA